jgi:peptidoglycan/xylan/chitin deacetylase (PgdA/CDA1 family)
MMVGINAQRYPEITARLVREGHEVENHSMTHPFPNLTVLPKAKIAIEVTEAAKLLAQFTGRPVRYFRPPGGGVNDDVLAVLKANNLRLAWWSVNVGDWSSPTPAVTAHRLREALRPGLVVLMHERENSVTALDRFLAGAGRDGYTYTTFSRTIHG